jgi:hypothetical protein
MAVWRQWDGCGTVLLRLLAAFHIRGTSVDTENELRSSKGRQIEYWEVVTVSPNDSILTCFSSRPKLPATPFLRAAVTSAGHSRETHAEDDKARFRPKPLEVELQRTNRASEVMRICRRARRLFFLQIEGRVPGL